MPTLRKKMTDLTTPPFDMESVAAAMAVGMLWHPCVACGEFCASLTEHLGWTHAGEDSWREGIAWPYALCGGCWEDLYSAD